MDNTQEIGNKPTLPNGPQRITLVPFKTGQNAGEITRPIPKASTPHPSLEHNDWFFDDLSSVVKTNLDRPTQGSNYVTQPKPTEDLTSQKKS